jgi:hypothetical protein
MRGTCMLPRPVAAGSSRIENRPMSSAVALTETAGYAACTYTLKTKDFGLLNSLRSLRHP